MPTSPDAAKAIAAQCMVTLREIRSAPTPAALDSTLAAFNRYADHHGVHRAIRDHFSTAAAETRASLRTTTPKTDPSALSRRMTGETE